MNLRFLSCSLLAAFSLALICSAEERPNIIVILADDMGYGDVQALNPHSKIPTPHLNQLAAGGMTFTDAHSPSAVCTPTRYSLITGRYCWRSRLKAGVLNGYGTPLIDPARPTIASFLKQHGYHTAIIGKWHLGLGFQKDETGNKWDWEKPLNSSPLDNGFTKSLVIPASLDFPPYVYVAGNKVRAFPDRIQPKQGFPGYLREGELGADFSIIDCLDHLTENVAKHIEDRSKKTEPFFLYFPLTAPHKPVLPHPRYQGKSKLGPYGDFVMQVDDVVGNTIKAIDDAGIAENTMIIYTSDNGSFMYRTTDPADPDHLADETLQSYFEGNHTANGVRRGTKADIWEAGHRVPFFVKWPAAVEAGSLCDKTITHTDIFATAADLIGKNLSTAKIDNPAIGVAAPDSFSILPLLKGKEKGFKRASVINHSANGTFAIRDGDWKLVLGSGSGGREKPKGVRFEKPYSLFNLKEDPSEAKDRWSSEPDIASKMEASAIKLIANGRSR